MFVRQAFGTPSKKRGSLSHPDWESRAAIRERGVQVLASPKPIAGDAVRLWTRHVEPAPYKSWDPPVRLGCAKPCAIEQLQNPLIRP